MSGSVADVEKPSDASHRWRRTRAMASTKVGRRFVVPGGLALGHGVSFLQRVGGQCGPGEEPQQDRRGAGDGQVGPLALGLHAQVGPHLLKEPAPYLIRGDLQLPAQDKPFQDLGRVRRWVGAQQGLGGEGALGIAVSTQRMRTGGLPERYQTAVYDVSSTVRVVPSYQATATLAQVTWGWSRRAFSEGRRAPFSGGQPG